MKTLCTIAISALLGGASPAMAQEPPSGDEQAGEGALCLNLARIRNTRVRDDQTIDFIMRNGDVYRNSLPHRCPQLGFERAFTYRTSLSELCNTDIITVLFTSPPRRGASCGLGDFVKIDPKAETAIND